MTTDLATSDINLREYVDLLRAKSIITESSKALYNRSLDACALDSISLDTAAATWKMLFELLQSGTSKVAQLILQPKGTACY